MHEVYAAPKGHWENIYNNFKPFGMGEWDSFVQREESDLSCDDFAGQTLYADDATGNEYSKSPLIPAKGKQWGSMLNRMGRKEMSARNERDED